VEGDVVPFVSHVASAVTEEYPQNLCLAWAGVVGGHCVCGVQGVRHIVIIVVVIVLDATSNINGPVIDGHALVGSEVVTILLPPESPHDPMAVVRQG